MTALTRKAVIAVLGVITVVYVLSMVVVTGKDLGVPQEVYSKARDTYMRPHLMQSWGLFAKGIVNSDKTIIMRAQVQQGDGSIVTTDWTDLGAIELDTVRHNPLASREGRTIFKMAGDVQIAARQVPKDVSPAISEDIFRPSGVTIGDYLDALPAEPELSSAGRRATASFINLENGTTRLTTLYAYRIWRQPVVAVQWYVHVSPVARFPYRDTGPTPDPYTAATTGWRSAPTFDEAVIRAWT